MDVSGTVATRYSYILNVDQATQNTCLKLKIFVELFGSIARGDSDKPGRSCRNHSRHPEENYLFGWGQPKIGRHQECPRLSHIRRMTILEERVATVVLEPLLRNKHGDFLIALLISFPYSRSFFEFSGILI